MTKLEKLMAKLKEPSTIKGLVMMLTLCGVVITPEKQEMILVAAGSVYAIIQVFLSEN
jgi:hypothetical protein